MDADFILALQLQEQFDIEHESDSGLLWPSSDSTQSNNNVSNNNYTNNKPTTVEPGGGGHGSRDPERPLSIVDASWEMMDPSPDVRAMFLTFNDKFFWGKLCGVEVKWSPRMTLCAGVCSYEGRGGLCSIRLSAPLLKLRPRRDLVETLLHEMIHALLFVTQNNRDRDGHGPEFCKHMNRINTETGTKISIYHSFNDEVDAYRTHWWRCNGPCQSRKPYLGYVKRAMNRAPSALDNWWEDHRRSCGGTYIKVKEPEGYKKKGKAVAGSKDEKIPEMQAPGNSKSSKPTKTPEMQAPGNGKSSKPTKTPEMQAPGNGKSSKPTKTPEMQAPGNGKSSKPTTGSGLQDIRSFIPFSGKGLLLGGGNSRPSTSSPAFSPKKPLFSPSSQTNASPSLQGRLGSPTASPWNRTGPSKVQGPPKKRSVGNTRYFTNVNGSPVKLPKPLPRGPGTSIPSGIRGRGDPKTTNGSIADIFNRRPLKTSSPSATVSKPPDETTGGPAVPSSNRNASSTGSESSLSTAIATTHKPSFNTVKKEESKHTSVFPATSKPSSAKPTKPGFFTVKKEESKHPSVFPTTSNTSSAKPNHSNHSEHANRNSIAGSGASRKRPLDDSGADIISFLREALGSESSPTSPEVKRPRVSPPSAHASSSVVAKMPSSSSHQATTSSTSTNTSFPSSHPSVSSTSGLRTGAPSSSSASHPSTSGLRTGAPSSSSASHPSTSGLRTGAPSSSSSSASDGVSCPVCQVKVHESKINEHLDSCLSW